MKIFESTEIFGRVKIQNMINPITKIVILFRLTEVKWASLRVTWSINALDFDCNLLSGKSETKLSTLAKKYLDLNQFYVVIVGDGARNLAPLKKLGYELIELDAEGKQK